MPSSQALCLLALSPLSSTGSAGRLDAPTRAGDSSVLDAQGSWFDRATLQSPFPLSSVAWQKLEQDVGEEGEAPRSPVCSLGPVLMLALSG